MESNNQMAPTGSGKRGWIYLFLGLLIVGYNVQAMALVGVGWLLGLCFAFGVFSIVNGCLMLRGGGLDILFEAAPKAEAAARAKLANRNRSE